MSSVGRRVRRRDTHRIQSVFCRWCGLCPPLSFERLHQSGFCPMLHWALVSVLLLLRSQPASQAWHSDRPPSLMPWGSSGARFLHLEDPPPSPVLCVSSLQPTSRENSVSPSLSVVTLLGALVNTVSANVCVAGSGCLLPSVWKLTEGRGYGQFCSQPCSCRTWCLMTIYSV